MRFWLANKPGTVSITYRAGVGGVNEFGYVDGETFVSIWAIVSVAVTHTISIGYSIPFIQNDQRPSDANTNTLTTSGGKAEVYERPSARVSSVVAKEA